MVHIYILSNFFNVHVNNAYLFACQGNYDEDLLAFTWLIVQCWLRSSETLQKMIPENTSSLALLPPKTDLIMSAILLWKQIQKPGSAMKIRNLICQTN